MFFSNSSLITIVIAAVASMALGFVWYSPWLFGTLWQKAVGLSEEKMKLKQGGRPMWLTYLMSFVLTLSTALVISALFNSLIIIGFWGITCTAFFLWVGFVIPVKLNDWLFGNDSLSMFCINVGYQSVSILTMAVIIGIFG